MIPRAVATRQVRSRGRATCTACQAPIPAGEVYTRETNVYDRYIYTWQNCRACEEVISQYWEDADSFNEGITPDELLGWAEDAANDSTGVKRDLAVAYLERRRRAIEAERQR